jgi:hypothetical protein
MVLLAKKVFLFILPLLVLTICYIITDPFQNILPHDVYLFTYRMLSRGNESTKVYLKNKDKYNYDSFIFGSSRSTAHTSREWAKYLPKNSVPYSFGAWNDPLEGMYKRIRLIDSLNSPLKNAFMIIDVDRTFKFEGVLKKSELMSDHYLISGISKYDYYVNDFYYYLKTPVLIITSLDYTLFHTQRDYMDDFKAMKKGDLDPVNNDWGPNSEKKIVADSVAYYSNSIDKFYKRPQVEKIASPQINRNKELYLYKISAIFKRHKTNYKIVIAPLYDQVKLNPKDLAIIDHIFGKSNVYDYSGINEITNNKFNYAADVVHYRKKVGDLIYKEIYH